MSETTPLWKQKKGVLALLVLVGTAATALLQTTNVAEGLAEKWRVWGEFVRAAAPWLWWGLLFYCATALLIIAYREWRGGKRALSRKRRSEIENLMNKVNGVLWAAEPDRPEDRDSLGFTALERAFEKLNEALAQASAYEFRMRLREETSAIELRYFYHAGRVFQRDEAAQSLAFLRQWVDFAAAEVHPEIRRPSDPLAPRSRS